MPGPDAINSMHDVRQEIDRIDAELVELLFRRSEFIDRAAEIKAEIGMAARIPDRVNEVLDKVSSKAGSTGLDEDLVRELWNRLIEWSIAREEAVLDP